MQSAEESMRGKQVEKLPWKRGKRVNTPQFFCGTRKIGGGVGISTLVVKKKWNSLKHIHRLRGTWKDPFSLINQIQDIMDE